VQRGGDDVIIRSRDHRSRADHHCSSDVNLTYTLLQLLTPFAQSSKMGTVTKGFDARLVNRPCLVFDFRALWRSALSARVPESRKLNMVDYSQPGVEFLN